MLRDSAKIHQHLTLRYKQLLNPLRRAKHLDAGMYLGRCARFSEGIQECTSVQEQIEYSNTNFEFNIVAVPCSCFYQFPRTVFIHQLHFCPRAAQLHLIWSWKFVVPGLLAPQERKC